MFQLMPPFSTRVEAAVLRWWIARDGRRAVPRDPRRREERRVRLYDRMGLLASKLGDEEGGAVFAADRPLASRLLDGGDPPPRSEARRGDHPPASGSLVPATARSASTPRRKR